MNQDIAILYLKNDVGSFRTHSTLIYLALWNIYFVTKNQNNVVKSKEIKNHLEDTNLSERKSRLPFHLGNELCKARLVIWLHNVGLSSSKAVVLNVGD